MLAVVCWVLRVLAWVGVSLAANRPAVLARFEVLLPSSLKLRRDRSLNPWGVEAFSWLCEGVLWRVAYSAGNRQRGVRGLNGLESW